MGLFFWTRVLSVVAIVYMISEFVGVKSVGEFGIRLKRFLLRFLKTLNLLLKLSVYPIEFVIKVLSRVSDEKVNSAGNKVQSVAENTISSYREQKTKEHVL